MIFVRLANESDCFPIFRLRNDLLTRRMSFDSEQLKLSDHVRWYVETMGRTDRLLLVCCEAESGERVAIVRFDEIDLVQLVSINLSPLFRGRRLSHLCLNESLRFFVELRGKPHLFRAQIKSENLASVKAFEKVGFTLIDNTFDILVYELDCASLAKRSTSC